MIRTYDVTPDWVYVFASMAGDFDQGKLSEAVLTAQPLKSHTCILREKYDPFSYESGTGLVGLVNLREYTVDIQYANGMDTHHFDHVREITTYITPNDSGGYKYMILFRALDDRDGELKWFVGTPMNVTYAEAGWRNW